MKYIIIFLLIFYSNISYAYLDPGTGSLVIQSVIAAIVGAFYLLKTYKLKLMSFFSKNKNSDKKNLEKKSVDENLINDKHS